MKLQIVSLLAASTLLFACSVPALGQAQIAAAPSPIVPPNFAYSGDNGPGFWDRINPACAATATSRQSPVDIRSVTTDGKLAPLDLALVETQLALQNFGFTVKATPTSQQNGPNVLVLDGTVFKLLEFHFHTLSEHTIDGRHDEMELHAVFESAGGHVAVIGVLFRIGNENALLDQLISAGLPEKFESPKTIVQNVNLRAVLQDVGSYYTYSGSFTTPPCSEVVTWFVLKKEAELSWRQFEAFRRILGNDFRPAQSLNDRVILATP